MNRRIPNGTYGGVRGRGLAAPSYSINILINCITFGHFTSYRDDDIIIVPSLDIIGSVPGSYVSLPSTYYFHEYEWINNFKIYRLY
jgi:hypothetical protein